MTQSEALKQQILGLIDASNSKLTPSFIENTLFLKRGARRKETRKALTDLIAVGELQYTYVFGSSFVEKSFNRPVIIAPSVIVKPHNMTCPSNGADIVINMFPGASFGSGAHPTTRLSVQGIEYALRTRRLIPDFRHTTMLDIGTGSGILAIAALKFGIETGRGIDTDPCSVSEAKKNARINGLKTRLRISDAADPIDETFSLITANLRFPDIMKLLPLISGYARPAAPVILSGIRPEECDTVIDRSAQFHFQCLLKSEESNWSCLVLQKDFNLDET